MSDRTFTTEEMRAIASQDGARAILYSTTGSHSTLREILTYAADAIDRHREVEARLLKAWDSDIYLGVAIAEMRKLTEEDEKKHVPRCPQCGEPATYQIPDGQWFDSNAHAWRTK